LLAATVQSNFVAQASTTDGPAAAMTGINRALLRRAIEARFATVFHGVLGPDGRLSYCNAGQEPPLLIRRDGRVEELTVGGPVVGLLSVATYDAADVMLEPGDLVVVCSDGVTEARNTQGDEYGRDRMMALLSGRHGDDPIEVLEDLVSAVNAFAGREPQADDITALVLRYRRA
jgi:sigma-B regulation protein RsbU (phosphoserine phosphatase)